MAEVLGPHQPSVFRATLDAGVARGGGVLELLPDGFHGGFGIDFGAIGASAIASLRRTPSGNPSFLAVVGVAFRPPIQLSFGFSLDRVGGLVAVGSCAGCQARRIPRVVSPHSLRHAAITAASDAGCSLRDVQDFARHADPRQTRRYDRARGALDRNPYLHRRHVPRRRHRRSLNAASNRRVAEAGEPAG